VFDDWMTTKQAAAFCGITRQFLWEHRDDGIGPPYHLRGAKLLYSKSELTAWINNQRRGQPNGA
jgi:predicted DNA-binding transcriptional regulator AlpA